MPENAPFDDIRELIASLPPGDEAAAARTAELFARDRAFGGAGALESRAVWLSRWSGKAPPRVDRPMVAVFAGAHGVARHGVSAQSDDEVRNAVQAMSAGQGRLSRLCADVNVGLKVLDLALDLPVGDITLEAALDERGCAGTMAFGMEAVAGGHDLLCLAGLGAGGTTAARVLLAALNGGAWEDWASAAVGQHLRLREKAATDAALSRCGGSVADPFEALRQLGGREIAAMCGAIIAARMEHVPVLLDGLPALAAAAVLHAVDAGAVRHCALATPGDASRAASLAETIGMATILGDRQSAAFPGLAGVVAIGVQRAAATCAG